MERKNQYLLTAALVLGLTEAGAMAIDQKSKSHSIPDSPIPATFTLPPTVFNPTESIPTETPFVDLTPTLSPTPEIPFGEHECRLPLDKPSPITKGFLEPLIDYGKPVLRNGILRRHLGVDFDVKQGTPIFSICDSELFYAGSGRSKNQEEREKDGAQNLGNVVIVRDVSTGYYILFAHLSKWTNKLPGEKITAGEIIGEAGHSGNWEDHLHIMVLTKEGMRLWQEGTEAFYGGDYSLSLTDYYANLEIGSDEEIAKRLIDPAIFLYQKTEEKIW